ncbi:replicative DNA helicase [Denitrobaculum tricleocarpae]|uniref:Replicative DNA helicase n=1 Tax=Denitrobaculum tricleocarpae TaxID=2591009 RepID=A0A545TSY0_9PROT|nr:replicative DNA helicase [Denitrobaculum tricleocarpae]TQV80333.1 replicative DNA helicase [Denitrobaculum tricleocarpae]
MSVEPLSSDSFMDLPQNVEAEQGLLGAILANNQAYDRVADFLAPDHFFEEPHRRIFEAAGHLINTGKRADAITLKAYFERDRALEHVGGAEYLAGLQTSFVTITGARDYGQTIYDAWLRRSLIDIGGNLQHESMAADLEHDGSQLAEQAMDELTGLMESGQRDSNAADISTLLTRVAEQTDAIRRGEVPPGLMTGLVDLDRMTGGFHGGELIILAGRPGMGKTALATKIAQNIGRRDEGHVAFFSLEMSEEAIARRIICETAGLDYQSSLQRDGLNDSDFERFKSAAQRLQGMNLHIDATPRLAPAMMHARSLGLQRRKGLSMIVVDHLGHVKPPRSTGSRHLDLGEITKALKATAKRLDVPVLLLCQLNRGVETREDKRPTMADLRESGHIEEDADAILLAYRDHYYASRTEPTQNEGENREKFESRELEWFDRIQTTKNKGDVIVAKQRNGATGTVHLAFIEDYMRWDNLAPDYRSEQR